MGPMNAKMKESRLERQQDIVYEIPWTTLGGYLEHLEERGVSTNVASFVGATTVRVFVVGSENRPASAAELAEMQTLVREAMREGAMGVGSSLPYAPAFFASTEELIALASAAAEFDGMYISHIRSEGDEIFEALDEFLTIVRSSGVRGEVYHLKSSQKQNWDKLDEVIARLEAARAEGLLVSADMYPYHASSTGLTINFPAWVKEGEHADFVARLKDPEVRRRMHEEMDLIPPEDIVLVSFRREEMRHLTGKTLAEVAEMWGVTPEEAAMDLIIRDDSGIGTVRFTMSEENVRKKIVLPWVTFCSDGGSVAPEPPFTNSQPHPRSYGTFARVLGKYVREEKLISLEEAIHRLTELPATNLRLRERGRLAPGYFADVVVFDPERITDKATFEKPHQLAEGVVHVFVNGGQVLRNGEHTGAKPGRFVRGPGWSGWSGEGDHDGEGQR
jgi:N-acyl-D-amino-acid deacylase